MINPPLTSQTSPLLNLMKKLNPKIIFHFEPLIRTHMMVNLIMRLKKSILTALNLFMKHFFFVEDANEWSKQIDEEPYDFNDRCDESSFEYIHELD
jgi:hypothetical protein